MKNQRFWIWTCIEWKYRLRDLTFQMKTSIDFFPPYLCFPETDKLWTRTGRNSKLFSDWSQSFNLMCSCKAWYDFVKVTNQNFWKQNGGAISRLEPAARHFATNCWFSLKFAMNTTRKHQEMQLQSFFFHSVKITTHKTMYVFYSIFKKLVTPPETGLVHYFR